MTVSHAHQMGLVGAVSYIIGNIVGSGIFIVPGSIVERVGSTGFSLVIWVASAVISVIGAFCYVELGTSIRRSGADFAYQCYVGWDLLAFGFMISGCVFTYPATIAIQARTFGEYVMTGLDIPFVDPWHRELASLLLGFVLLWLLLFLNFFSVKTFVSRFQVLASIAKVAISILVIATGFWYIVIRGHSGNLENMFENTTHSPSLVVDGLFSGLFSYDGWDIINLGLEEIHNPRRTLPLAIVIALTLITLFYVAMNVAFLGVLGTDAVRTSTAVAMDFARVTLGDFSYTIPFLMSIILIGSLNSTLFAASRWIHAAAREGHLPAFISITNEKHRSPRVALFTTTALSIVFSFVGGLNDLIQYVSFGVWLQRFCTLLALLWIRFRRIPVHPEAIQMPIVVPIFFLAIITALVVITVVESVSTIIYSVSLFVLGLLVYVLFLYDRSLPRFAGFNKVTRRINVALAVVFQLLFDGVVAQQREEEPEKELEHELASYNTFDDPSATGKKSKSLKLASRLRFGRKKVVPVAGCALRESES